MTEIADEFRQSILRKEFYMDVLNCDPMSFCLVFNIFLSNTFSFTFSSQIPIFSILQIWNLSVLKFQNLICNFTNGFIACINFYGIKYLIHTNPSDASVNDIGSAKSASNIG